MKHPIMSTVMIDKISMVRNTDDLHFIKTIAGMIINETKEIGSGCIQTAKKKHYNVSIRIYPVNEDGTYKKKLEFVYLQLNFKSQQVRIEYNPSKLNDALYNHLDMTFMTIMGQTFFEFIAGASVTRIDVNTHIHGHTAEDFLFKFKKFRVSQTVCGQSGHIETIYAGRSKGNCFKVYDKAKQLNGHDYQGSCLRIEATIRNKMPVQSLSDMVNPFLRVVLFSLIPKKYPKGIHKGHWQGFADSVRLRGTVGSAIKMQPKDVHNKLKYCLSKNPVEWWKPDIFWGERWYDVLDDCGLLSFPKIKPLSLKISSGDDYQDKAA